MPTITAQGKTITFPISPLIKITLLSLYVALTVPLPFLSQVTSSPISPSLLWLGIVIGLIVLYGALTQKVVLNEEGIAVTYPAWIPKFLRQEWFLSWTHIKKLKPRSTGQGGLVYYFLTEEGDRAYLLPMRVAGFAKMVKIVEEKTGIDTTDIRPLSQPWMYIILLSVTALLLLVDGWTIITATSL
ncbi:MAG: hypothetical protein N5P05_001486 [Chroococcopsis gigantea SAG 12.99]|jgi:hypothetical protein|nr:hypothetical protein [Chlorogloea purpurea SAG 13.99]MDV2999880.1 hypothetical protein [Chroococcopsis gigantea SAG 12.99]